MTTALFLLLLGALQQYLQRPPSFVWAVGYTALLILAGWYFFKDGSPLLDAALGFYAWGYFLTLRRTGWTNKPKWVAVYLLGALVPTVFIYIYLFGS
ncbi:hypothetical protein [Neisseria chenwenguii]|uniref:Uncharacterized protein n=1 Tax=Neisseria chenwenguii TaxID=1853278 RepID=A0A220S3H4_9NEIS|nr:hypothetical protein [Neisseria chenwenguii]ASK27755.1 hypothetical protein BG910_08390 [Neisseria chenwenguii]ROV56495.1 hypothetical protein EGS38_03690 [Neisseria chenwenguii]